MSTEGNKTFIRRYLNAISGEEKPAALLDEYIADADATLKQHISGTEAAFPRYELIPDDMIAEGDRVAVRMTFRGVHEGPMGELPATGKAVSQPFQIIYRIRDGKIVEHWTAIDRLALMQQLEALPAPAAT